MSNPPPDDFGPLSSRSHLAKRRFPSALSPLMRVGLAHTLDLSSQGIYLAGRLHGKARPAIHVLDEQDFGARLCRDGLLGFGEAFMNSSWSGLENPTLLSIASEMENVVAWLTVTATKFGNARRGPIAASIRRLIAAMAPTPPANTLDRSRAHVAAHYDLPVDFFKLFLDESLTYSSADFRADRDLQSAQHAKAQRILQLAGASEAERLLDIGCGWGSLLLEAAQQGIPSVVGLTLSESQAAHARVRAREVGLDQSITVRVEDYREHVGEYDSITSVEMLEAVGSSYWVRYFRSIDRLLAQNGRFALQTITFPHARMRAQLGNYSWTDKYIFPGGELCSLAEIDEILRRETTLEIVEVLSLSSSYAKTLRAWRQNFCANVNRVLDLGFDEPFCLSLIHI